MSKTTRNILIAVGTMAVIMVIGTVVGVKENHKPPVPQIDVTEAGRIVLSTGENLYVDITTDQTWNDCEIRANNDYILVRQTVKPGRNNWPTNKFLDDHGIEYNSSMHLVEACVTCNQPSYSSSCVDR